jgi:hypothetical protein
MRWWVPLAYVAIVALLVLCAIACLLPVVVR